MKKEERKDSRIHGINLLSNGYVVVMGKDKPIDDLCGAWPKEFEVNLRSITPTGVKFGSWGILPHAIDNMKRAKIWKAKINWAADKIDKAISENLIPK